MESKKTKSRDLTTYQYFQILQEEWIVADLRSRIYPPQDKVYWNKVKDGKKKTIEQIADKNHLLSTIFVDEEMKAHFENKIYGIKGYPNFIYKDEQQRMKQESLDFVYYFMPNKEVRVELFDEQRIGLIKSYVPGEATVTIVDIKDDKLYKLSIKEVTRIL